MEPKTTATATIAISILSLSLTMKLAILGFVILIGANSYAYSSLRLAREEKRQFGKIDYLQSIGVASFSGTMFFLVAILWKDEFITGLVAAGVGAFTGFAGSTKIGDAIIETMINFVKGRK